VFCFYRANSQLFQDFPEFLQICWQSCCKEVRKSVSRLIPWKSPDNRAAVHTALFRIVANSSVIAVLHAFVTGRVAQATLPVHFFGQIKGLRAQAGWLAGGEAKLCWPRNWPIRADGHTTPQKCQLTTTNSGVL